MNFLSPISFSIAALITSQTALRLACAANPFPMPHQFATFLDHPLRMAYRNVSETLSSYGFTGGMNILDLGCGNGTFTVEMARMVGAAGIVHAIDLQRPLLDNTRQRVVSAGLDGRVRFHQAGATKLPLADQSIDLVVLIATLGEIDDKLGALNEVRRLLKPGGRLAISEEMPDPAYLAPGQVRQWTDEAGFDFVGQSGTRFCYSMLFSAPE